MRLTRLEIRGLRCLREVPELEFHPELNLIAGANAAGKTTLLEAVDLLARTRSFRARNPRELIAHGAREYLLRGEVERPGPDGARAVRLSQRRDADEVELRINAEPAGGLAQLAACLAVQTVHPQSHRLVGGAPRLRRAWLDWGVFHVEQEYFPAWAAYRRALRQRNAALRSGQDPRPWDAPLARAGEAVGACRKRYLEAARDAVEGFGQILLPGQEIGLEYLPGFDADAGLARALADSREASREAGHTAVGPHRADVAVRLDGRAAAPFVSGGQAKLLSCCLLLGQTALFQELRGESCVLLFDELAADLDGLRQERLMEALAGCEAQLFITRTGGVPEDFPGGSAGRVFHVEQGRIRLTSGGDSG